ncbi:MAG: PorP/SprF family type IX secretion system membrane protein [Bacteroidota bacterium]
MGADATLSVQSSWQLAVGSGQWAFRFSPFRYFSISLFLLPLPSLSQTSANQMQYLINPSCLSPALFENTTRFSGFLTYRSEWTGFQGKPSVALLDISGIAHNNMYFGGEIRYQTAMVFRSFYLALKYAYQIRIREEQYLTLGVNGIFYQNILDLTAATILDPGDPLLQGIDRITQTKVNIGAGLSYRFSSFILSFYAPMLLNNRSAYDQAVEGSLSLPQNLLVYISNDFIINREWLMKPTVRINILTGSPTLFELSLLAGKIDQFWFTAMFRSNMMMGLTVGGQLWKHVVISYGYEFFTGNSPGVHTGTHEITLGYKIGKTRIVKPELKDYFSATGNVTQ